MTKTSFERIDSPTGVHFASRAWFVVVVVVIVLIFVVVVNVYPLNVDLDGNAFQLVIEFFFNTANTPNETMIQHDCELDIYDTAQRFCVVVNVQKLDVVSGNIIWLHWW